MTRVPPTWPDGRVKLPEVLRRWVDGHCEGGMDDDPEMCEEHHNVVSVALWSLIYRQGYEPEDQAALDAIAEFADHQRVPATGPAASSKQEGDGDG